MSQESTTRKHHRSEMMAILCLIAYGVNSNAFGEFAPIAAGISVIGFLWFMIWTIVFITKGE